MNAMQVVRHLSYFVPAPPGIDPKKLEGSQDPGKLELLRVRPKFNVVQRLPTVSKHSRFLQ